MLTMATIYIRANLNGVVCTDGYNLDKSTFVLSGLQDTSSTYKSLKSNEHAKSYPL
jgi:hypothetical protein